MYQLKVNQQQSIIALHEQGWSGRRIARELGLDRGTVGKYLAGHSKPATNPQPGSVEVVLSKPATNPQPGSATVPGPASLCDPWREQIEAALALGLSIQRIYQDLVVERQFTGSYFAVRRFVLRRVNAQELPFRRMECAPGQELQVDFGLGAWVIENGKRRRPHLLLRPGVHGVALRFRGGSHRISMTAAPAAPARRQAADPPGMSLNSRDSNTVSRSPTRFAVQ